MLSAGDRIPRVIYCRTYGEQNGGLQASPPARGRIFIYTKGKIAFSLLSYSTRHRRYGKEYYYTRGATRGRPRAGYYAFSGTVSLAPCGDSDDGAGGTDGSEQGRRTRRINHATRAAWHSGLGGSEGSRGGETGWKRERVVCETAAAAALRYRNINGGRVIILLCEPVVARNARHARYKTVFRKLHNIIQRHGYECRACKCVKLYCTI